MADESKKKFLNEFTKEMLVASGARLPPGKKPQPSIKVAPRPIVPVKPVMRKPLVPVKKPQPIAKKTLPSPTVKPVIQKIQAVESGTKIGMAKLDVFFKDPRLRSIECPGPGKFVIVKYFNGRINVTKITLNKNEIEAIVRKFGEEAKIPIIGGLFKVWVKNLLITAVLSKIIGTRFIITKITPFESIEKQEPTMMLNVNFSNSKPISTPKTSGSGNMSKSNPLLIKQPVNPPAPVGKLR